MSQRNKLIEQGHRSDQQGRRIALVVGVNDAPRSEKVSLKHALDDAKAIAEVLQQDYCGFELLTTPLLDEGASSAKVKEAVIRLIEDRGDDDLILFYFSGHGDQINAYNGQQDVFLVTDDYSPEMARRDPTLHVSLRWLREYLYNQTEAGRVLILLDCCYSGYLVNSAADPDHDLIRRLYAELFEAPPQSGRAKKLGFLRALTATGPDTRALEQAGHGAMTRLIISALQGREQGALDDRGEVTTDQLNAFLKNRMPPDSRSDLQGADRGYSCVLAKHKKSVALTEISSSARPARNHIPLVLGPRFQKRPDDCKILERLLLEPEEKPARVGLVGMPGIGKRQLAAHFAQLYQERFPDGVFWVDAKGTTLEEWQRGFANLARSVNYRPANNPGDEISLASYIGGYLANHPEALLILENVDNPALVQDLPPKLAGEELQCAILYTSTNRSKPEGITTYRIPPLSKETAYDLLLGGIRSHILTALETGSSTDEALAASTICKNLNYHPMMLDCLRELLRTEPDLTLTILADQLRARGALDLTSQYVDEPNIKATLLVAFRLLWEKVNDELVRHFFKLSAHYPETTTIPLWLLGLASGLGASDEPLTALWHARQRLDKLSLIDYLAENHSLQLHPLVREFGQQVVREEGTPGAEFLKAAGRELTNALEKMSLVRERAREDYWVCLEQMREALRFIENLTRDVPAQLQMIVRYLDQGSHLLAATKLWPDHIPGLFHQQMHNRAFEERESLEEERIVDPWLRQANHVGATKLRPERTFAQHSAEVTGVAFSRDGSEVLTGSQDATARLTEAKSGRALTIFKGHRSGVTSVAFSPDGNYVLTGSQDTTARLWLWKRQLGVNTPLIRFEGHNEAVNSVAFSYDGKYVLTGSQDKTARLWDRETGTPLMVFVGHQRAITSVAFSPRDGQVLTSSWDNTVRLWDQITGDQIKVFAYIIETQWDITKGEIVSQLKNAITGEIVYPSGRPLGSEQERVIECIAISPDGRYMLVGSNDATARLWEIDSGKIVRTFSGHNEGITSVAFSPDRTRVVTGSSDGTARVWETESGSQLMLLDISARVDSVAFSPNGERVLTGSNEKLARLWDIRGLEQATRQRTSINVHSQPIGSVAMARRSDGSLWCLTGSEDKVALLWDVRMRRVHYRLVDLSDIITSVAISPNGRRLLAGSAGGEVYLWRNDPTSRSHECTHTFRGHTIGISCASFSPDQETILTASWDGTTRLWKAWIGREPHTFRIFRSPSNVPVEITAFSHTGNQVLTGMVDGSIGLWSIARSNSERIWKGHNASVVSVAFSPDNSFLLSSAQDEKTYIWSASGELIGQFAEQEKEIAIFAFSPNGKLLLTCDRRGSQIKLWKIHRGSSEARSELCGVYDAYHRIGAVFWLSDQEFLLADTGGSDFRPYFYQLKIENSDKLS